MSFDVLFDQMDTLCQLLDLKEGKQMTWEQIAHALYQILDDIDTADNMCKENTEAFRTLVMKLQAKKNQYVASFDGQTVQRVNEDMSQWARDELERAGLFDKDSDYNGMVGQAVMDLIDEFSKQGHSGFSAGLVSTIFDKLVKCQPLTPLTDDPAEWMDITEDNGKMLHQSRRSPSCFSTDGGATYYNLDEFTEDDYLETGWVPTNPERLHTSKPHKERDK